MEQGRVAEWVDPPFASVLANTPAVIMVLDRSLTITWANDAIAHLFGYSPGEAVGRSVLDFLDPEWNDPVALESVATAMNAEGSRLPMLFRVLRPDGTPSMVEVTANSQFHDPTLQSMVVLVRPWDERHLIDQALEAMAAGRPLHETLELLVRIAEAETLAARTTIVHDLDSGSRRTVHSATLPAVLAAEPTRDGPDPWPPLLAHDHARVWEVHELPDPLARTATEAGYRTCWIWPAVQDGRRLAAVVAWRPEPRVDRDQSRMVAMDRLARVAGLVVAKSRADAALNWAASHDPLTGLANRARFFAELERAVDRRSSGLVGVIAVDLDGFKPVNDRYGHAAGDEVLCTVARRIEATLGPGRPAARLGGDEFVAVTTVEREADLDSIGAELAAAIGRPVTGAGHPPIPIGASVGVAAGRPGRCRADQLVRAADDALYRAKASGQGGVCRTPLVPTPTRGAGSIRRRAQRLRRRVGPG